MKFLGIGTWRVTIFTPRCWFNFSPCSKIEIIIFGLQGVNKFQGTGRVKLAVKSIENGL